MMFDSLNKNKIWFLSLSCVLLLSVGAFLLWSKSINFYNCLVFSVTKNAQSAFVCGNYYFGVYGASGYDVSKAEFYFGRAVEINPKTPDAWHQYARTAFLRGDFVTGLYRINKQIEIYENSFMASYYIRGLIYGYAKNYSAAERDFKKFLEWDPTSWAANNDLAWIYFAQGKFEETKTQSEVGLAYNQNNPWLHMMHAMAVYNLWGTDAAYEELLKARESASRLAERDWAKAYPGNDPKIAGQGLAEFKKTIEKNIELVHSKKINP